METVWCYMTRQSSIPKKWVLYTHDYTSDGKKERQKDRQTDT